jgi:hypothetical protein
MYIKQYLGYLGLIPFILTFAFGNYIERFLSIPAEKVFIFYSAIILSFIAGTLWRKDTDKVSIQLQVLSNLFSLLAFLTLFLPSYIALVALSKIYLLSLLCEYHFDHAAPENYNYLQMRMHLTALVVTMHIIAFVIWCI